MLYFLFNYNLKQMLDCLILLTQVNGHDYHNFLRTQLSGLLEDAFLSMLFHMWFQHSCAPPRCSCDVLQRLSKNYEDAELITDMSASFLACMLICLEFSWFLSVGIFENFVSTVSTREQQFAGEIKTMPGIIRCWRVRPYSSFVFFIHTPH
jgi:hypothetical protein